MDFAVRALNEKRRHLQEMVVERLQHSDLVRKVTRIMHCVQTHPVLFTLLGLVALVVLSPVLVISAILMAPLFFVLCSLMALLGGIFVVFLSFLSGFLFNFLLFAVTIAASCYIVYYIIQGAICRVQKLLTYIASCPSRMHHSLKSTLLKLCSELLDGISGDLGQRLRKGEEPKLVVKGQKESESSELEDIEPDYRDRECKLYEALVSRQYTGGDTFEPFPK